MPTLPLLFLVSTLLPVSHTMPNGCVESRSYDPKERLLQLVTKTSGGAVLSDIGYTFDRADNRKSLTYNHLGGGEGRFDYDGEYRLVGEAWKGGSLPSRDLCYHYDANGNRLARISGNTVTFSGHDAENRLLTEVAYAGSVLIPDPQVTASSTQEGFSTLPVTDTLTPDSLLPADAWASEVLSGTQHSVVLDFGTAKPVGKLKLWIPTGLGFAQRFKVQAWDADAFRDLEGAEVTGAKEVDGTGWYRATGHRVVFDCLAESTSQVRFLQDAGGGPSGSPDQAWLNEFQAFELTRASSKTLAYDPAGLLLSETGSGGDVGYGYDWGYRLKSYKHRGTKATYVTDVLGRRLSKTVRGSSPMPRERYAYDGQDVIGDYAGSDLATRYTNGPGIDQKLTLSREGQSQHFVQDALGSTHQLLDASEGVAAQYLFDAWGNPLQTTGVVANRFGYTGQELDKESGKWHYDARTYDPARGIFLQRDPSGEGLNHRIYVRNNPVNFTDPTGRRLKIAGKPVGLDSNFYKAFKAGTIAEETARVMIKSRYDYEFTDAQEFDDEVILREAVINSMWRLSSKARFGRPFEADPAFWRVTDGSLALKDGGLASREAIDALFSNQTRVDCAGAVQIACWGGLARASDRTYTDYLGQALGKSPLKIQQTTGAFWISPANKPFDDSETLPGDLFYFPNHPDYPANRGDWQGENAVYAGGGLYRGFGLTGPMNRTDLQGELKKHYTNIRGATANSNKPLPPPVWQGTLYHALRGLQPPPK